MIWDEERWPNFTPKEFACPCGCGILNISPAFLDKLQSVRSLLAVTMKITSGGRCPDYNMSLRARGFKSVDGSAHTMTEDEPCEAADIECTWGGTRFLIIEGCMLEFNRIGISSSFIHVDSDESKTSDVIWTY
jgi:uncharacterized protein YcbK (DUF882 family)